MYLEFHHNCYLVLLATLIKYSEKIIQKKKVILDHMYNNSLPERRSLLQSWS